MRIRDWSSDVCSSDLLEAGHAGDVELRLAIDGARVAEGAEAVGAVVIAHPRRPDPAKGQILHRIVKQDVVDRHAAGDGAGKHALLLALVLPEIIKAEGAVVGVHIVDGVVDGAIGAARPDLKSTRLNP